MRLHRNIYLWYATTFLSSAAFILPIWVIFNTSVLGLSNSQAFLLGVLPYGLSALFEVPTGSWADKYGRARTFRIGFVLYIFSVASYIFFKDFYILLFFQVLGGLGLAMQSGGLEALVHDSIEDNKDKDAVYAKVHGRKMALLFCSRVVTVLVGGWMFAVNPRLPFVVATITYITGFIISLFFVEVRAETPAETSSYKHIKETFSLMLGKRALVLFFVLIMIYTFLSEGLFALYQPYFQSLHINVSEFGIFYAIISLFSALGALVVAWLLKRFAIYKMLSTMMLAVLLTLGLMLLRLPWLTYAAIIPSAIAFGLIITLQNTITQKLVSSRHQATAVSIASLIRTSAFLLAVVGLGAALDIWSVHMVNAALAILTVAGLVPFLLSLKRQSAV